MSEPMITIKKPDGTFAKVPLSEFKKMSASRSPAQPSGSAAPASSADKQVEKKPKEEVKNTSASAPIKVQVVYKPVNHAPVHIKTQGEHHGKGHVSKHKTMTREDAASLLEERIPAKTTGALVSSKRESQVEEVVRKIGFGVAPDLQGRLKSLILARLKDIKSEDEIREMLSRPVKNSGLGLTEIQIDKIIKSCREVAMADGLKKTETQNEIPALKGNTTGMALMVEPPELPMVVPVKNNFSTKTTTPPVAPSKPADDSIVSKIIRENMGAEPMFKISDKPVVKQIIQDVSMPDIEMGPVEEFKSMTVTDFRRLSSNPEEAAKRLQQKMSNLQEESFVWYLDAVAAYHNSPLYLEYMSAIAQSLSERKSLANVLAMKNGIKLNEVMAIIEMEKAL